MASAGRAALFSDLVERRANDAAASVPASELWKHDLVATKLGPVWFIFEDFNTFKNLILPGPESQGRT
jgi:hypothetical protein